VSVDHKTVGKYRAELSGNSQNIQRFGSFSGSSDFFDGSLWLTAQVMDTLEELKPDWGDDLRHIVIPKLGDVSIS